MTVPVQEPWTSIVRDKSNNHLLSLYASGHHVSTDGVFVVEGRVDTCALDNIDSML